MCDAGMVGEMNPNRVFWLCFPSAGCRALPRLQSNDRLMKLAMKALACC